MKIAFINNSTGWGGLEMNTLKLATLLTEKDYQITLITCQNSTIYKNDKDIFVNTVLINNKRKYIDLSSAKLIGKSLQNDGIRTLMVFDNKDLDVAAWTKRIYFKKLIIIYQQHMQIGIDKKDILHTLRFKTINNWISPLHYLKDEVVKRTKFPEDRIKVIPLCLDVNKFINRKYTKQEALQLLNLSPKAPLIGIIGRISQKKGQLFLIECLMKLKQEGVNIELLIFGSSTVNDIESQNYYTELCNKIKENNLEDIVHLKESNEDVALFYNSVDVFALASHSETYGMVTIEAMLSKLPIIATNSGGTSEILDFGKLGLLYEYENHNDFCDKLKWLIDNKTEAENIALKAQQTAIEKYKQEIEVNEIDRLINELNL